MRFKATDVYDYYKPSECVRRVALRARDEPEQETDTPFVELLRRLGHRHEASHLTTLPGLVDLSQPDQAERERLTLAAIRDGTSAIYQPRFRLEFPLDGEMCELVGEPDFLIRDPAHGGYLIRDSKLAHNPLSDRHPGIPLQLQIYGFLYERAVGQPPLELQVHAGTGQIVPVPYEGEAAVLEALREHRRMRALDPSGYEPIGWTKCGGCGFEGRCGAQAKAVQDVSLLTTVPQRRARELHARGIPSISDIPGAINNPAHREYFWTGKKNPHVKDFVPALVKSAESYLSKTAIHNVDPPALPAAHNFAMFDLEGLPPYIDDLEKIYLWGAKVFGDRPSEYRSAQAGFGPDGDREGWFAFLRLAGCLFADYGDDLRFVHWSPYERTKVKLYIERYGDLSLGNLYPEELLSRHPETIARYPERSEGSRTRTAADPAVPSGIATHVLANLIDLHALVKESVVLPLPSYSLKVVEDYVGFERKLPETGGQWSIAKYIEAIETNDPGARDAIVCQILAYNEEDLDATRAVVEWLRALAPF